MLCTRIKAAKSKNVTDRRNPTYRLTYQDANTAAKMNPPVAIVMIWIPGDRASILDAHRATAGWRCAKSKLAPASSRQFSCAMLRRLQFRRRWDSRRGEQSEPNAAEAR